HSGAGRIFKELYVDADALRKQVMIAFEVKTVEVDQARQKELPPLEKDTEMFAKKTSMETNPAPAFTPTAVAKPRREPVDLTQRYDVYCVERNQNTVVYRNVRFKSGRALFPRNDYDQWAEFVELETSDGQSLYLAKPTIIRFNPAGA